MTLLRCSLGWHGQARVPGGDAQVLIPLRDALRLRQGHRDGLLRPPLDLLYLPPDCIEAEISGFWGWRLGLDPQRLWQRAAELSGHRLSPGQCRLLLRRPRPVHPQLLAEREQALALRQLLPVIEAFRTSPHHPLAMSGLDGVIERLVLLLLCGETLQPSSGAADARPGSKARIIDELITWIQANLDRSFSMADLEARSGYSQRSLRNAFHERFGCAPVQWIRSQRLQGIRQRLLHPLPEDSVSAVAAAFGYGHLSQLSQDFQAAYGMRPSELLRESRCLARDRR